MLHFPSWHSRSSLPILQRIEIYHQWKGIRKNTIEQKHQSQILFWWLFQRLPKLYLQKNFLLYGKYIHHEMSKTQKNMSYPLCQMFYNKSNIKKLQHKQIDLPAASSNTTQYCICFNFHPSKLSRYPRIFSHLQNLTSAKI